MADLQHRERERANTARNQLESKSKPECTESVILERFAEDDEKKSLDVGTIA